MKRLGLLTAFVLVAIIAATIPPSTTTQAQANCFSETGFCISNSAFAEYFRVRGGVRILGYPISRSFTLEGFEVQFFQRVVLQLQGGQVQRLNLLDPTVMPMTRANQSVFPGPDASLASQAPQVGAPDYATQVVNFVRTVAPDNLNGQNVGFFNLFNTTVPVDIAFGGQTPNPDLVTLLNLEIWGLPTSRPAADPGNGGFIYQRFQRGIMHFDASCGCTQGILVGDYFKSVITGRSLPPDLAADMASSRYYGQYNSGAANWVARPEQLPNTNLTNAFEPGTGSATPPPPAPVPPPPAPAGATATPTAVPSATGPTVTIQVDDDQIDPGQTVSVTVIARYSGPIEWLEFEGVDDDNNNDNADAATDAAFQRKKFDCDDRTECATVWTITPQVSGRYKLRGRAEGVDSVRSEWVEISFRVRGNSTGPTATPAATTAPTSAPTTAPTAAATPVPTTAPTATPTP